VRNPLLSALRSFLPGATGYATPDVTRAQQLALGQAIVAILVVFGFDVDEDARQLILALSATLAAALPISDAVVRQARAKNVEQIEKARQEHELRTAQPELTAAERNRLLGLRRALEHAGRARAGQAGQTPGSAQSSGSSSATL
jgi:hypothetical protein